MSALSLTLVASLLFVAQSGPPTEAKASSAMTEAKASSARETAWQGEPYESHRVDVAGHPMHYVDVGAGDPVLLLHGIPAHGYLWRNVVGELDGVGRVVVPDLMGYGKSYNGPDLEYAPRSQQRYFDRFMDALELDNVTLVVNDLGSVLGLHWASRHPERVKAIVLVEAAMLDARSWWRHLPFRMKLTFRLLTNERRADRLIVDKNMMVETMLGKVGVRRKLTEQELDIYREPFSDPKTRARVLLPMGPAAMPLRGRSTSPWDVAGMMDSYAPWLRDTKIPKLLLWSRPGLIAGPSAVRQAKKTFTNLESVQLGRGVHFLAEDHPERIGAEIEAFIQRIDGR